MIETQALIQATAAVESLVNPIDQLAVLDRQVKDLTEKCKALKEEGEEGDFLRVSVVGGGCSGYQYGLDFDKEERIVFPLAERVLKAKPLTDLGAEWVSRRASALK